MKVFIIRRYRDDRVIDRFPLGEPPDSKVEGTKEGIIRAENVGIILAEDEEQAYTKAVRKLNGQLETILTDNTNERGTRLYQTIIRTIHYNYFLEKTDLLIV